MVARPIAKITAAIAIIGTMAAYFGLVVYLQREMNAEGYAFMGLIIGAATMFLFSDDLKNGGNKPQEIIQE